MTDSVPVFKRQKIIELMEPLVTVEIKETDDPWGVKMRSRYRDLVVEENWETNPELELRGFIFVNLYIDS